MSASFNTKDVLEIFNARAEDWEVKKQYISKKQGESRRLFQLLESFLVEDDHVLDLGCGTGKVTRYIDNYFKTIRLTAADISFEMLKNVSKQLPHNLNILSDAESLCFSDELFNVIVCQQVLHHVRNPQLVLDEMFRVTRANGHLMLLTVGEEYNHALFPYQHNIGMKNDPFGRTNNKEISTLIRQAGFRIQSLTHDYFTFFFESFNHYFDFLLSIGSINKIHRYQTPPSDYREVLRHKFLDTSAHEQDGTLTMQGHYITIHARKPY